MKDTGYFVRIYRDGGWVNIDLAECTEEEVRKFFAGRPESELINWLASLQKFIKEIG